MYIPLVFITINCLGLGDNMFSMFKNADENKKTPDDKDVALYQQATAIVRDYVLMAAPLDQLEAEVKKNPNVLLPTINIEGREGTLLQLAIIGLDQTIKSMNGIEDEGMAERLMKLHVKFLPETVPQALEKARLASFDEFEVKETKRILKKARLLISFEEDDEEAKQLAVLNTAFNIVQNNKPLADIIVKNYIKSIKPAVMTDNRYYLNLLQLLYRAFGLLATRGEELEGRWFGAQAHRFCLEIIGGAIEAELPPRQRQILMSGYCQLLYQNKKAGRLINLDPEKRLGVDYYYNTGGCDDNSAAKVHWGMGRFERDLAETVFQDLFRTITSASKTYAATQHSEKQVSDEHADLRRYRYVMK